MKIPEDPECAVNGARKMEMGPQMPPTACLLPFGQAVKHPTLVNYRPNSQTRQFISGVEGICTIIFLEMQLGSCEAIMS